MKKVKDFFKKMLTWLNEIGKDKYQHFSVGTVIAAVGCLLPTLLGAPGWLSIYVSIVLVAGVEMFKEYSLDQSADIADIFATFLGAAVVWVIEVANNTPS